MSQITAKVIAYSISPEDKPLISVYVHQPRIIIAETNTHAALSKSSSSSRAIPVKKVLAQVWNDPFIPVKFGSHQPGMQSGAELRGWRKVVARGLWKVGGKVACVFAWSMMKVGLAKEVSNRVLEPWQWTNTILTGTDWGNFFALRDHKDAQPEMQILAHKIKEAIAGARPQYLNEGEYHLPYIEGDLVAAHMGTDTEWMLLAMSAARCARVSYGLHDGSKTTPEKDLDLFEKLAISKPAHSSPLAHQAKVDATRYRSRNFQGDFYQFREMMEVDGVGPYAATGDTSVAG